MPMHGPAKCTCGRRGGAEVGVDLGAPFRISQPTSNENAVAVKRKASAPSGLKPWSACSGTRSAGMTNSPVPTRAFDEKVESIVGSHDGTNRIQHSHWYKGASHEWGSLILTICANVSLLQSKPVTLV